MRHRRTSAMFMRHLLVMAAFTLVAGLSGPASGQQVASIGGGEAAALEFDSNMLMRAGGRTVDLSRFARGNPVLPGTYRSDVYLNDGWLGRHDITLVPNLQDPQAPATPCLQGYWIPRLRIDPEKLSPQARAMLGQRSDQDASSDAPSCLPMTSIVEGGTATFDPGEQRLSLTAPQAHLQRNVRGYVPPEAWTEGVTAGRLNYMVNHAQTRTTSGSNSNTYIGLDAGLNVGAWQLRHQGAFTQGLGQSEYQHITTNVRRDLKDLGLTLTVGDAFTDGQLLDSFGVRGVMLSTDDRMMPESQRGYAPVIRGEARSQAKVQVRQNGALLYDITVPPGPFVIDDLNPAGLGSDLVVTITEADGAQRSFNVPYSPVPMLLREGQLRYGLVAGSVRNMAMDSGVLQGSVQYGLNSMVTLNGAASVARNYHALLGGAAISSAWGGWAVDYTSSRLEVPGQDPQSGGSLRASWSKAFASKTNLSFASYRYSSRYYYGLQDALREQQRASEGGVLGTSTVRARNRIVLNVSQTLGETQSLYFTASSNAYWSTLPRTTTYQIGYSRPFLQGYLSLAASRETSGWLQQPVNRFSIGMNFPLSTEPGRQVHARTSIDHDDQAGSSVQTSVSGSMGTDNRVGWGLYTTKTKSDTSASASINHSTSLVQLSANVSHSKNSTSAAVSAMGGLVAHSGGITLAPPLGETIGLVKVDNGQDVRVLGAQAAPVDRNGYTVIPYLTPYQLNTVELDFSQASLDLQVDSTNLQAAPQARAVASFHFTVPPGRVIFIRGVMEDSISPLPFGAIVFNSKGEQVGAVGQAGKAEARVTEDSGELTVKWGDGEQKRCSLVYSVPPATGPETGASTFQPMISGRCTAQMNHASNRN